MDIEIIKALSGLPFEVILIYLLVRQQAQIERLLTSMVDREREHSRIILEIMADLRCLPCVETKNSKTD